MERTFIILKPDAVQRGLVGEIIKRFEQRGLKLVAIRMMQVSNELASAALCRTRGQALLRGADLLHHQARRW